MLVAVESIVWDAGFVSGILAGADAVPEIGEPAGSAVPEPSVVPELFGFSLVESGSESGGNGPAIDEAICVSRGSIGSAFSFLRPLFRIAIYELKASLNSFKRCGVAGSLFILACR